MRGQVELRSRRGGKSQLILEASSSLCETGGGPEDLGGLAKI